MNLTKKFITVGSLAAVALFGASFTMNTTNEAIEVASTHRQAKAGSSWTGNVDTTGDLDESGYSNTMFYSNFPGYEQNGFNLSTYQAAVAYANAVATDATLISTPKDIKYRQTKQYDDTGAGYINDMKEMYDGGANVIISSGFQVAATFEGVYGSDGSLIAEGIYAPDEEGNPTKYTDKHVVLLDDNVLGTKYENAVSVQFAAEGAGYEAGLVASLYTLGNYAAENVDNQNIVMWGGINYGTVYSFMSGFAQAIETVNAIDGEVEGGLIDITLWSGGDYSDTGISAENTYGTSSKENAQTWYSGGFGTEADTKLAIQKTENALDAGASVVFPVAGGNTGAALDTIASKSNDSQTVVIGVDTDNTIDYAAPEKAELIIGSATKSLVEGGLLGLLITGEATDEFIASDLNLIELQKNIANWEVDTVIDWWTEEGGNTPKGTVLQGTIDNGGVGFTYENENGVPSAGAINAMLDSSLQALYADTELWPIIEGALTGATITDSKTLIEAALATTPDAASINAADDFFTTIPVETEDDSSLLWLWITLAIIAVLSIVGVLVYFLVLKKD